MCICEYCIVLQRIAVGCSAVCLVTISHQRSVCMCECCNALQQVSYFHVLRLSLIKERVYLCLIPSLLCDYFSLKSVCTSISHPISLVGLSLIPERVHLHLSPQSVCTSMSHRISCVCLTPMYLCALRVPICNHRGYFDVPNDTLQTRWWWCKDLLEVPLGTLSLLPSPA